MPELVTVVIASLAAGFVNSIAGGGGLIALPVLLGVFPTAPVATLLGTSKAAMVWGTLWAAGSYSRHVRLPWHALIPSIVTALAGGLVGAWLVTLFSTEWLRHALPVMLLLTLAYTLMRPGLGRVHSPLYAGRPEAARAAAIAGGLGLYDGFFGPGTGSFLIFLFVRVLGYDFLHAAACAKILNATTNLAALAAFAWGGHVWWRLAVPMAVANVLGSMLGARMALRHGSGFIRAVFAVVVGVLILKTGYDAYLR